MEMETSVPGVMGEVGQNEPKPNQTIYVNNLNERIKKEGKFQFSIADQLSINLKNMVDS